MSLAGLDSEAIPRSGQLTHLRDDAHRLATTTTCSPERPARYQVQVEELDCSLFDCGKPYSRKVDAIRIARHLAKNAALDARNFLVFDNRTELFVFTAKVKPLATHRAPSAVVEAALAA